MIRNEPSNRLRLQQKLAPQLIQSLRLLQMSTFDLAQEVKQQIELNPLLKEVGELREEWDEELREREEGLEPEEELPEDPEEVYWDAMLTDQFDAGAYNSERTEYDPNWEANREPQANRITAMPPLLEPLYEQVLFSDLGPEERDIAEYILGNMDERGFVGCSPAEMAADLAIEVAAVRKVLRVIQTFEPPGVGARDVRECLMIQLGRGADPLSRLALRVVRDHLDDLARRRMRRITRALGISDEKLKEVLQVIEQLQPHPNLSASSDYDKLLTLATEASYITPDLIIKKVGNEWVASLADESVPSIKVNSAYQHLLNNSLSSNRDETDDYIAKNLDDARWLISAIHQRRTTMLKVADYLLRVQLPFFEEGPARLRPMVLQDLADAIGMHVSTISRVSNGKYVQTPHGVFELKYFFDNKLNTDEGEAVSVRSVKEKISQLVAAEDKVQPLTDQQLVEELNKGGLKIARRTVAKYRDQLKIPSQRYRREL